MLTGGRRRSSGLNIHNRQNSIVSMDSKRDGYSPDSKRSWPSDLDSFRKKVQRNAIERHENAELWWSALRMLIYARILLVEDDDLLESEDQSEQASEAASELSVEASTRQETEKSDADSGAQECLNIEAPVSQEVRPTVAARGGHSPIINEAAVIQAPVVQAPVAFPPFPFSGPPFLRPPFCSGSSSTCCANACFPPSQSYLRRKPHPGVAILLAFFSPC